MHHITKLFCTPAYASISMCLFNHLSIHPSLYSSINLPIYLFIKHLFIKQIIHSSIHLSIYLYPSIHPSIQLSINQSIYPSIRLSFLSSHQQFLHIAYLRYPSIHPSLNLFIYTLIPLELQSSFTILSNVRYCNISWLNISSGSCIKDSIIRVLLNITGKSYFLRPKPAFPSSGILSVIKVLKLRSPVRILPTFFPCDSARCLLDLSESASASFLLPPRTTSS